MEPSVALGQLPLYHKQYLAIRDQAIVPRYALFHTLRPQGVAEHVGRGVQILSLLIAQTSLRELKASHLALQYFAVHDLHESVLSDIPFAVKRYLSGVERLEDMVDEALLQHCLKVPLDRWELSLVKRLVDTVDMAELVMHCTVEVLMGNQLMAPLLRKSLGILKERIVQLNLALAGLHHLPLGDADLLGAICSHAEHAVETKTDLSVMLEQAQETAHV